MGLSDGMTRVTQQMQDNVRVTVTGIFGWFLKILSAAALAFTITIIAQEVLKFALLAFLFVMIVITGTIVRLIQKWTILNVLAFDLLCVLVGLGLKMYILLAP